MQLIRLCVTAVLLPLCSFQLHAATPAIGQPAPPLAFTQIYGAPQGARTDWPSLRGKVVVLEFWATWCAPCIAEIPHLNALAASLASSNVQFIAVDDEDPALIRNFLAKKPITGWVGLVDPKLKFFDDYGAQFRPTTVVIDTEGRIAARVTADSLTKDQLITLAAGKPVAFPEDKQAAIREQILQQAKAVDPSSATAVRPLFEISISAGDPDGQFSMTMHDRSDGLGYYYDLKNAPLSALYEFMAGIPASRLILHGAASHAKYTMHIGLPGTSLADLAPAIQLALASAAGMKLSHAITEEDTWVLQATPKAASLLSPTASSHGGMCFYSAGNGKLTMVKTSLDGLAPRLEEALGAPVVNETHITGEFDANLELPKGDAEGIKKTFETNLGLTLIKAKRSVDRIVLDPLPPSSASQQVTTAAEPHQKP